MLFRSLQAAALVIIALAPQASAQSGLRFSVSRAVSNNNSDNTGVNVSGSQVVGNTFGPDDATAGAASALFAATGSARATVPGGTVAVTGGAAGSTILAGALTEVLAQLASGSMTVPTAGGGSMTVTFAPALGQLLASSMDARTAASAEATDDARLRTAVALEANGLDRGSATRTANALLEVARMQAAGTNMSPAAASMAAAHATAAVTQMSAALSAFMLDAPKSSVPAPMLAVGVAVRAAAATALPLPAGMTR